MLAERQTDLRGHDKGPPRLLAQRTFFSGPFPAAPTVLYHRMEFGAAARERDRVSVAPHAWLSTNTYFGRFPASYWQRWTEITEVELDAVAVGSGELSIVASDSEGGSRTVATAVVNQQHGLPVRLTAKIDRFVDGGALWLDVRTEAEPLTVEQVRWSVPAWRLSRAPGRPGAREVSGCCARSLRTAAARRFVVGGQRGQRADAVLGPVERAMTTAAGRRRSGAGRVLTPAAPEPSSPHAVLAKRLLWQRLGRSRGTAAISARDSYARPGGRGDPAAVPGRDAGADQSGELAAALQCLLTTQCPRTTARTATTGTLQCGTRRYRPPPAGPERSLAVLNRIRHALRVRFVRVVEEVVVREVDRAIRAVHDVEFRSRRDLHAAGERDAVAVSERFAREVMPTATTFPHPRPTLEHALALAPTEGMALEFGVFSGGTLRVISEARGGRQVYGFDSFKGLPEDWRPNISAKTFETDRIPEVPGAELVVGWFDDTLPEFLAEHPGQVAFLHIDCDLYSSTKTVLDHVGPRLAPGAVIVFDEYFNYPGWEQHEYRAWQEYVARTGVRFQYEAYTSNNEQVVIRLSGARADQGEDPSS